MLKVNPGSLRLLIEICEQPDARISGGALKDHYPGSDQQLIASGLLRRTDNATIVVCRACTDGS